MSFDLLDSCEEAFAAVLSAAIGDRAQVVRGKNYDGKTVPCIIVVAHEGGEEDPVGTGDFWITCEVMIKTTAPVDSAGQTDDDTTRTRSITLVTLVNQTLMVEGLHTLLNDAVDDFTTFGALRNPPQFETDGDVWVNTLPFRLPCCPSTIPAS